MKFLLIRLIIVQCTVVCYSCFASTENQTDTLIRTKRNPIVIGAVGIYGAGTLHMTAQVIAAGLKKSTELFPDWRNYVICKCYEDR